MPSKFLTLLLVVGYIIMVESRNHCGSDLFDKCFCGTVLYDHKRQYVVNCTDTGFNNTEMLTKLPPETNVLVFTGNHIPVLPWNVFGELNNLTTLATIDMSNNGIREVKGKSYHHVPNVKRLILNHNNLTISSQGDENYHHPRVFSNFINLLELHLTNAFADNTDTALANDLHDIFVNSNLTKLFRLHLEQNEIKGFKDEFVFCDLPNLEQLYLGDNYLPGLNFNISCLKKLNYLDLEHNNITEFSQKQLENFDKLTSQNLTIEIRSNPLRCDNAIKYLYNWIHKTNITVRNKYSLQCHKLHHGDKYIINLKNLVDAKDAKFRRGLIILFVLILASISILLAYIYFRKNKGRSNTAPFFNAVSRKVYYTTIESQDV